MFVYVQILTHLDGLKGIQWGLIYRIKGGNPLIFRNKTSKRACIIRKRLLFFDLIEALSQPPIIRDFRQVSRLKTSRVAGGNALAAAVHDQVPDKNVDNNN